MSIRKPTSIEFCAGAGGQALGLERAGFEHRLLLEIDKDCCRTLMHNRRHWNVECADMNTFDASAYHGVDLMSGGLPCPPFSIAGKQLGQEDERDLFPAALRIAEQTDPKFVMIENVKGFLSPKFKEYRESLRGRFWDLGYDMDIRLYNASQFGVSQLRPRMTLVAGKFGYWEHFEFPDPSPKQVETVGGLLRDDMSEDGWPGAEKWAEMANRIAPTIVGGSKKHGGPDLGPTRARAAWKELGVNGSSIAEAPPSRDFQGMPRLTPGMVAKIQGFPPDWEFIGSKTSAYRQIGNAFPPPVAEAIGLAVRSAINACEGMDMKAALVAE